MTKAIRTCVYCQTKLDKRAKDFCPYCGTSLTGNDLISNLQDISNDEIIKICGGIGEDDDMSARGDFINTVQRMRLKLEEMKDCKPFTLVSNFYVKSKSKTDNHMSLDNFRSEYDVIKEMDWIENWIEDEHMKNQLRMIGSKGLIVETGKYFKDLNFRW